MEKRVQLFVRRLPGGAVSASVLGYPHLSAFASSVAEARADLGAVLEKLLSRDLDGLAQAVTWWPRLELRRVELRLRAWQQGRLLPVPMRFTVLVRPTRVESRPRRREGPLEAPVVLSIPRLGIERALDDLDDLDALVDELVRHALFMAPFDRLREVSYDGPESVETLTVRYKPLVRKEIRPHRGEGAPRQERPRPLPPGLDEAARRLNDEAAAGMLGRAYQRDAELATLTELLTLTRRASLLLLGETSAGKSALVHELAHRAHEATAGAALAGLEVYSTSGARIIAGMRYLGEWQARLQRMVDSLRARHAVLHIESLGEFLAAFESLGGLDGAGYLLPAVESGELTLIVEATPEELARAERTHAPFVQALRTIALPPLDRASAWTALHAVAQRVGRSRGVGVTPGAIRVAGELSERYTASPLPGGAAALLRSATSDAARGGSVDEGAVFEAFTRQTGYPRALIDPSRVMEPDAVLDWLRARVVGQDAALRLMRDLVITLKAAMGDPRRPAGSFLLLGPTGVGKTESALRLAEFLFGDARRLVRFDMSEYADPGSASRLVGLYGSDGAFARRLREQPFCVLLLDEIEKADASVHDLLLQVLSDARITDATGSTVRLHNAIVMMTSNLGADGASRSLGFGSAPASESLDTHYRAAAAAFFRPEFLNRIDHVVPYLPLSEETVHEIARRALAEALAREGLSRRRVKVRYGADVVKAIAAQGFDPRYGARPLKRAIERSVVAPIAAVLAARGARAPASLRLEVRDGGVVVRDG